MSNPLPPKVVDTFSKPTKEKLKQTLVLLPFNKLILSQAAAARLFTVVLTALVAQQTDNCNGCLCAVLIIVPFMVMIALVMYCLCLRGPSEEEDDLLEIQSYSGEEEEA